MFEIQKSGDKTSSGEIGLDIRTHASPKVGQDQMSGGVSVLCWHADPLHMFYGNLAQLGKKSNSVIRSRSVLTNQVQVNTFVKYENNKSIFYFNFLFQNNHIYFNAKV